MSCISSRVKVPQIQRQCRANFSSKFGVSAYGRRNSISDTYAHGYRFILASGKDFYVRTWKLQILPLCVYAHNCNRREEFFCVRTRKLQILPLCVYAHRRTQKGSKSLIYETAYLRKWFKRLEFLCICADVLVLEFLQTYAKRLHVSIMNLRIYANGERLEFLRICADVLVLEFLQTCAKSTASLL